jgi:predicted RNA binding protein YcfA (HicA-like mRNA interferase family)
MKYREVARRLKALECQELPRRGKGSHRIWINPANGQIAPVPDWGSKDLKLGTLRAIIRQLDLDWGVFLGKDQ